MFAAGIGVHVTNLPELSGVLCRDVVALQREDNRINPNEPACQRLENAVDSAATFSAAIGGPAMSSGATWLFLVNRRRRNED